MDKRPGRVAGKAVVAIGMAAALVAGVTLFPLQAAFGQQEKPAAQVEPTTGQAAAPAEDPPAEGSTPTGDFGDWPAPATRPSFDGHGRAGGSSRPSMGPLRDEMLWKMLGEFYPDKVAEIRSLREKDPARFAQIERQMRPWLRELREAHAQNPKLAELMVRQHRNEMAIHQWQARYTNATEEQRPALAQEGASWPRRG